MGSPSTEFDRDSLQEVHAFSPVDVWAVGQSDSYDPTNTRPLIQHYDGTDWSIAPSPVITGEGITVSGISGSSPDTMWAVGTYWSADHYAPLVLRWDGTAWTQVQDLDPDAGSLEDVSAYSDTDAWAVGESPTGLDFRHWDGSQWVSVTTGITGTLLSVDAFAPDDVWAVGTRAQDYRDGTLTMHWDGTQWSLIPSPNTGTGPNVLLAVETIAADDVWATGYYYPDTSTFGFNTLAMHWDGTAWTIVPSPNFDVWNSLTGLAAFSTDDVWALGQSWFRTGSDTVALHWDGNAWTRVPTVDPDPYSFVDGVTALPNGDLIAVGMTGFTPYYSPLIERYASTDFDDVPQSNTFYPYIKCLACRSIVQGYPDHTFRPNAPVTRGQIAKIVLLSAGIAPFGEVQTFGDVPPGSTFYNYVESMGSRGWMTGYPCGGPAEPCDPENRPYFRPGAGATRGQLSKIVSNAAGFADTIPETQYTFTDVEPGSTFWLYIERMLQNRPDAIAGYPCGSPTEPCDSENRPYFRPNNGVTRGQASKIVANTFFPGCNSIGP